MEASVLAVSVRRAGGRRPAPAGYSTVAMALHDQLLGAVGVIEVRRRGDRSPIVIDRSRLDLADRPVQDAAALWDASNAGPQMLPDSVTNRQLVLPLQIRAGRPATRQPDQHSATSRGRHGKGLGAGVRLPEHKPVALAAA